MNRLGDLGRWLLAISVIGFGVQQFIYSGYVKGLTLIPWRIPAHTFWAYFMGALLIICGLCIAFEIMARLACSLLGALFFACVLVIHLPDAIAITREILERTRAFETLAISGGAFVLARMVKAGQASSTKWDKPTRKEAEIGWWFFAVSMLIFGVDQLESPRFIATEIPTWIPAPLFFAYLTGIGFIAAGLAIATKIQARLAAAMLGLMFFLWVLILHAPRVANKPHNGDEWNSLLVALAMAGCSFFLAASPNAVRKKAGD
jgi:uncharacterized membrane protein YphA (DoxX/SURF4 family)